MNNGPDGWVKTTMIIYCIGTSPGTTKQWKRKRNKNPETQGQHYRDTVPLTNDGGLRADCNKVSLNNTHHLGLS